MTVIYAAAAVALLVTVAGVWFSVRAALLVIERAGGLR